LVGRIPSMHTLARFPAREARLKCQAGNRAFTLIELLTVIGIIAILSSIAFGVIKGVNERAAIGQAKAELAALSQSLEAYKKQYGDYPQTGSAANVVAGTTTASDTDGPGILFNALTGKRGPSSTMVKMNARSYLDLLRFSLQDSAALPGTDDSQAKNALLDPWGRRYVYYYKTSATWVQPSYVLMSSGPDGLIAAPLATTGDPQVSDAKNLDNLYANR